MTTGIINLALTKRDHIEPCPFCGGWDLALENTHTASYWVACNDCNAQVSGEPYGTDRRRPTMRQHRLAKASALKAWNRRDDAYPRRHDDDLPVTYDEAR
jgi:Lar family restriction alleviation protein